MKIAADTNVLLRALMDDDPKRSALARLELEQAEHVFVATAALCEVVWVLSSAYRLPPAQITRALRSLVEVENVSVDRGAVEAGIAHLDAGGDFADGAIAHDGRRMGAAEFVSFDREAVRILETRGEAARLL